MSDSLRPHESQHARSPCPSPTPGVHSNSRPLSWWCHPAISSSVSFSSCPNPSQHQSLINKIKCASLKNLSVWQWNGKLRKRLQVYWVFHYLFSFKLKSGLLIFFLFLAAWWAWVVLVLWVGIEPKTMQWKCGILTTGPSGNSPTFLMLIKYFINGL